MEFQIGDRVTVSMKNGGVGRKDRLPDESLVGTICCLEGDFSGYIGVAFDDFIDGHSCDGACENGYGWFIPERYLVHETEISSIPMETILEVISSD